MGDQNTAKNTFSKTSVCMVVSSYWGKNTSFNMLSSKGKPFIFTPLIKHPSICVIVNRMVRNALLTTGQTSATAVVGELKLSGVTRGWLQD